MPRRKPRPLCSTCHQPVKRPLDRFCSMACRSLAYQGSGNPAWKGGNRRYQLPNGYVKLGVEGQPYEHVVTAERALGRVLPPAAEVHHVNEVRHDNRNRNLVICQDSSYHKGLHARLRVLRAGGHPFRDRLCGRCNRVKPFAEFGRDRCARDELTHVCKPCLADKARQRRRKSNYVIAA